MKISESPFYFIRDAYPHVSIFDYFKAIYRVHLFRNATSLSILSIGLVVVVY